MELDKSTLKEAFEHLLKVISSERFQKCQGLGNEVPFYICHFPVSQSIDFEKIQSQLIKTLSQTGIRILNINLYDLSIEILKKRKIWDKAINIEPNVNKKEIEELLQGVLDTERHLIPEMRKKMDETPFDTLFLSGVGEVFPYIRSHNILNNLQSYAKEHPTVMFFPGKYQHSLEDGASLNLFGILHDDKYYRAFDIFHCEI